MKCSKQALTASAIVEMAEPIKFSASSWFGLIKNGLAATAARKTSPLQSMTTLVRFTLSDTSLASQAGSSPAGNEPPITPNSLRRARTLNRAAIFFASADVHDDDSAFTFVVSPSCTKETLTKWRADRQYF